MKLGLIPLTLIERIQEFDEWITPTLTEIKDTDKYNSELNAIASAIELIGEATDNFDSLSTCTPKHISDMILNHIKTLPLTDRAEVLRGVTGFLFIATGKSDNNCKCQFQVFLKNQLKMKHLSRVSKQGKLTAIEIPRVLSDERIMDLVVSLTAFPIIQREIYSAFLEFILNEDVYQKTLWSLGSAYFSMKAQHLEREFLMPLVIFKVRGSVSATGGHEPEVLLRARMAEWGLKPKYDYNVTDVIIPHIEAGSKAKTRAFDFVLPYANPDWEQRIFIQSQFYAGDSGSVSHKNVDQMRTSRDSLRGKKENPIFLEYVDGAGYYGSLNGDLIKIFNMPDTYDFFQIRTAPIKLRDVLQKIHYLTPLEYIHHYAMSYPSIEKTQASLLLDGYSEMEIDRVYKICIVDKLLIQGNGSLEICEKYFETARKYYLLDLVATNGKKINPDEKYMYFIVPGHGSNHGISITEFSDILDSRNDLFSDYYSKTSEFLRDIDYLKSIGWINSL